MASTKGLRVRLGPVDGLENSAGNVSFTPDNTRSESAGAASIEPTGILLACVIGKVGFLQH